MGRPWSAELGWPRELWGAEGHSGGPTQVRCWALPAQRSLPVGSQECQVAPRLGRACPLPLRSEDLAPLLPTTAALLLLPPGGLSLGDRGWLGWGWSQCWVAEE